MRGKRTKATWCYIGATPIVGDEVPRSRESWFGRTGRMALLGLAAGLPPANL